MTVATEQSSERYSICWEIEIEATSPEAAAHEALRIQRNPGSIATVFTVTHDETGKAHEIDLYLLDADAQSIADEQACDDLIVDLIATDSCTGVDMEVPVTALTTESELRDLLLAFAPWPTVMTRDDINRTLDAFFKTFQIESDASRGLSLFDYLVTEAHLDPDGFEVVPDHEHEGVFSVRSADGSVLGSFSELYAAYRHAWEQLDPEMRSVGAPMGFIVNTPAGYQLLPLSLTGEWCWQHDGRQSAPKSNYLNALWSAWKDFRPQSASTPESNA